MQLESKMLAALEVAVDDGDIKQFGDQVVFAYQGEVPFLRDLICSLNREEKALLFYEWLADGDEDVADGFLSVLTSTMPNVSGQRNVLADKILKHYSSEVDQMFHDKNKAHRSAA
jgi:hypothetical protein